MKDISAIILAAGEGKRMGSNKSKVLCEVLFKPMINWVIDSCKGLGAKAEDICVVTPVDNKDIIEATDNQFIYKVQKDRLGTAHAVDQARSFIKDSSNDNILILLGDAPLVSDEVLKKFCNYHIKEGNSVTVLSSSISDPKGYGRIVKDKQDNNLILKIVEELDCKDSEREISEINSGVICFKKEDLLLSLDEIDNKNNKGEFYLTSAIDVLRRHNKKAGVFNCNDPSVVLGANNRYDLLKINDIAKKMIIKKLAESGVEFISSDGVVISPDVKIGSGTTIFPGVVLKGKTTVGKGCVITSGSQIQDSEIGDGTIIKSSYIESSVIGSKVKIGPFANIRPNCEISSGVKIGDFVEIKNSKIGDETSVAHLTYVGDSDVGQKVNFGCGCVTVNYDGKKKYRTVIGNGCFIGCNTNLVAPVKVGDNAYTAAGTTVTDDIPAGSMCIARSRQVVKKDWQIKD